MEKQPRCQDRASGLSTTEAPMGPSNNDLNSAPYLEELDQQKAVFQKSTKFTFPRIHCMTSRKWRKLEHTTAKLRKMKLVRY